MDQGPGRAPQTKSTGYRFQWMAVSTLAIAAMGYFVFDGPGSDAVIGLWSPRCDAESAAPACVSQAAPNESPDESTPPATTGHRAVTRRAPPARPLALPDTPADAAGLRASYTMAELCAGGLTGQAYHCETGSYDGTFRPAAPGVTSRPRSGHRIAGRVLTPEGEGVAGIAIVAAPERLAGDQQAPAGRLRFWTLTDALGAYALDGLPDGEYTVRSRARGAWPSARITARAGVDYADLVVAPGVALVAGGKVVSTSGEPLSGVTVLPLLPGQPSVLTGDDGDFSVPVTLKPGARAFALRFQGPGFHEQTASVDLAGGASASALTVVMQPVAAWTSVRGAVESASGGPLAGRTVELRAQSAKTSYRATTDAKGRYAFPLVEAPADYRLVVPGDGGYRDHQRSVHVTADMGELDVVLAPYEFGAVSGQLVNLSGEPVPHFELVLRNMASRAPNALVSTDEDGQFELPAVPAGQLVVASQSTPAILVEGLELTAGGKLHLPLVLDWGEHEIHGHVVDERGRPVPASRILLEWSHREDGITTRSTRRTAADAQGQFAFSRLGPGPHALRVDAPGFAAVTVEHDVNRQGYDLTVRLN